MIILVIHVACADVAAPRGRPYGGGLPLPDGLGAVTPRAAAPTNLLAFTHTHLSQVPRSHIDLEA